jgi:general secretion pathway protein N
MMELLRRYPMASAFALLALVLVAVLAAEYGAGARLGEHVSARGAPAAAPVQAKLLPSIAAVNPDQEYSETGARPLFTPTRRPAPPAAAPTAPTAMAKGQFTLTGVTIVGPLKIALLREKSSGRVVRVEEGKEVNGITVAQVDPEQVKLTQGGDSEVVAMLVTKGGGAHAPPPPPTAAAGPFAPVAGGPPPVPVAGGNPVARAAPPPGAPSGQPQPPAVNPNTLFGPRPSGLSPGNSFQPTTDPTTATPPTSQSAPLTPEELLARRRARRNQQPQ